MSFRGDGGSSAQPAGGLSLCCSRESEPLAWRACLLSVCLSVCPAEDLRPESQGLMWRRVLGPWHFIEVVAPGLSVGQPLVLRHEAGIRRDEGQLLLGQKVANCLKRPLSGSARQESKASV